MRALVLILLSCGALAAQLQNVQQTTSRPEDLCTVEGTVVNAATGTPLKKATIIVNRIDLTPNLNAPVQPYTTTTDAAGKFAMKDLEPGRYNMRVSRNGFVTTSYGARGRNQTVGATLTLSAGQHMKEVNFRLTPHGVITGHIVDEDGEPMPSVQVQLFRFQYRQGKKQLDPAAGGASTNDLGEFRIFGVASGKYYLRANGPNTTAINAVDRSANSESEEDYIPTYYPGTTDPNNATQLEVTAGAVISGINFALSKSATVHIRGRIAGNPGDPRRPIQLILMPRNTSFVTNFRPFSVDSKGNFDLRGVAPGQYWLNALTTENAINYSARVPVDVGSSNVENVIISFNPPVTVFGRVRVEGGTQHDLTNVDLLLQPHDRSSPFFGAPGRSRLRDDYSFEIQNTPAEVLDLVPFGLPDGFYVKSIKSGEMDVLANGLDLTGGAPQPLDVVLSPNAGLISGVVQNLSTSQPAPGAQIALVPQEKERREQQRYYQFTTTDQNGSFTFKSIAPGEYKLYAFEDVQPGAYMDPEYLKPFESQAQAMSLQEGDRNSVTLTLIPADSETQTAQRN